MESLVVRRPAVGCIAWLGVWRDASIKRWNHSPTGLDKVCAAKALLRVDNSIGIEEQEYRCALLSDRAADPARTHEQIRDHDAAETDVERPDLIIEAFRGPQRQPVAAAIVKRNLTNNSAAAREVGRKGLVLIRVANCELASYEVRVVVRNNSGGFHAPNETELSCCERERARQRVKT
jgi:hypothetical protein